jgi:hypothetical protein
MRQLLLEEQATLPYVHIQKCTSTLCCRVLTLITRPKRKRARLFCKDRPRCPTHTVQGTHTRMHTHRTLTLMATVPGGPLLQRSLQQGKLARRFPPQHQHTHLQTKIWRKLWQSRNHVLSNWRKLQGGTWGRTKVRFVCVLLTDFIVLRQLWQVQSLYLSVATMFKLLCAATFHSYCGGTHVAHL